MAAVLAAGALLSLGCPLRAETERYAIVVGVADYLNFESLWYADDDALDFRAALLSDPEWHASHIRMLINSQATKAAIQTLIANMAVAADADDICIFFFSGHGSAATDRAPFDEADGLDEYLCPYDSMLSGYDLDIRDDELSDWLAAVGAEVLIVFLDTCHAGGHIEDGVTGMASGAVPKSVKSWGIRPARGDGFAEDIVRPKRHVAPGGEKKASGPQPIPKDLDDLSDIVVVAACAEDESSFEYPEMGNGAFTYVLLQAIESTLTDANADGQLSGEEVFDFLAPRVSSYYLEDWPQSRQHPQLCDNELGESNFVAAPPPGPASVIADVNFSTSPGWTTEGSWHWGTPLGGACEYGETDPPFGHTGPWIYGYNHYGQYPDNMAPESLTTTAFNCSAYDHVRLRFWRWLGVEGSDYDQAKVQVSLNLVDWFDVWGNEPCSLSDTEWLLYEYDISAVADRQPAVYLRWVMGPTDEGYKYCGWNIDDVQLRGDLVPLVISAGIPAAESWVYQNTAATTQDRHLSTLTVSIDSGAVGGETYAVTVGEGGGALTNFTTQATGDPLVVEIVGGRIASSTPSAPASCTLNVTVTGTPGGQVSNTVNLPLMLCEIGDLTGEGFINVMDKVHLNAWLNGVPLPGDTLRHVDLTGDGFCNVMDAVQINRQLNGLGIL